MAYDTYTPGKYKDLLNKKGEPLANDSPSYDSSRMAEADLVGLVFDTDDIGTLRDGYHCLTNW